MIKRLLYIVVLMTFMLQPSYAQIIDSSFYSWSVYEIQETELDYKKCYILAHPIKSHSDHPSRAEPYVMIARYQEDRNEEVTIYSAGGVLQRFAQDFLESSVA